MSNWSSAAALVACLATSTGVSARGATNNGQGSFVPASQAQRVMYFDESRLWGNTEGVVLVCPLGTEQMNCRKSEARLMHWVDVHSLKMQGYEISGLQFVFTRSSGDRGLLVYFVKSGDR